ncbi:helicase [Rhizoctonia solani]|uniref:Helicase n=1 Tax=Rhizoctonia solani TaxID=456999 RepID=A0A8H7I155_9AGAM|nr:helicase [Rhizoctonia solani]
MPLTPVAHSVLYLFEAAAMNKSHPLTCPPWTSNVWRELFGLFPLKVTHSWIQARNWASPCPVFNRLITKNRRKALGLHERQAAERFLQYFWDTWKADYVRKIPIRKTIKSTTQAERWPDPYGKGGVMNQVEETLGKIGATPADLWKDDRSLNRERPATKRVLEHQVPIADTHARLEERDVQAALARALFGMQGSAVRKYENLARSLKRKVTTSCARMQKVNSKLEGSDPPRHCDATRALTDWRKIAIGTKEVDELHFLSRERTLKQLWSSLGFGSLEDDLTASKSKSKSTQDGPSKEEMQAAYAYYVEEYCYGVGCLDESELPIPTVGVSGLHSLVDGCKDIGVLHLKSLSTEALWAQLGLPGVDQFPFAEPGTGESAKDMAPLAKTVRCQSGDCAQPTLLCDNVGLGKTVQIIGVISMIQHYYKQQELPAKERLATPMFIQAKLPYFAGQKTIPNLPSIVITPRTLGNQWMEQWKKFTQLGSFVPVRYSVESGTLESFCSDPTGPYRAAAGQDLEHAGRVVIIADLWLTLWNALWVAAVDEIHNLQNSSHTQRGVQLITQSLSLVIGATATPLFTLLKCLLALGQNLRYQPLLGEQGVQVWNEMQEMLSTGNESWRLTSTAIKEELESKYQAEDQRSILHMIHVSKQPLNMLRLLLLPIMIRRTNESLDYLGRRILDLPFVQKFIAWAPMNEEEKEMQRVINQEHTQQKSKKTKLAQKAKAAKRQKRKRAQDNVGGGGTERLQECQVAFTDDWTVENLPQKMSTRMQCVMGLIEWFWIGNPKPVALLEDGTLDKARLVQEPLPSKKPRKFLIYVEFQQHQALIAKMLTLKEKDYVTYNGSMATTKRQRSVEKFANDPSCRIMIISNVGSAGLNLVEASVVIIVSSVWSGLELDQIMGALMPWAAARCSYSKAQLSNHFLSLQRTLQTVYSEIAQPHSNDHDELDLEEIPAVSSTKGTKPSTSKAGPRKRKSQNEQCSQDANAVQKLALAKALGSQVSGAPSSNLVPTTQSMQPLPTSSTGSTEQTDELLRCTYHTPNAIGARTMVASSQQKTKFHAKKARLGHSSSDPSLVAAATAQPSQPLSATGPILVPAKKRTAPSMDPPSSMPTRTDPAASGSSSRQAPIVPRPSGSAQPRAATATPEQLLQLQPGSSSTAPTTSGHSVVTGGGSSQRKVFRLKASKLSASNHSVDAKK